MAAIKACENFNVEEDVERMIQAVMGLSSDRSTECAEVLIELATKRAWFQRDDLVALFRKRHGERIAASIRTHLGDANTFGEALCMCFEIAPRRDAEWLYKAMEGLGSIPSIICEIICTRNSRQLETIKIAYQDRYGRDLVKDVESEYSGSFQKFLVKLLTVPRSTKPIDQTRAMGLAKDLYDAGEARWSVDKEKFIEVFTSESKPQLAAMYAMYETSFNSELVAVIQRKFTRKLKDGLVYLCRWIVSPHELFAESINKAIGSDQKALVRLILSRADMDLERIKQAYENKYNKPLAQSIADGGGASGDLLKLLQSIVN